jgi:hypothetical protein
MGTKKKYLVGALLAGVASFGGVAAATSAWEAVQDGSPAAAQAANLTIHVNALTAKADVLPDTDGTAAHVHKDAKGSLAFSVQNTGSYPLKIQSLDVDAGAITSDKSYDDASLGGSVPCAARLYLNPSIDTSAWPVLQPGATLYVDPNGSADNYPSDSWVSGAHLVGLDFDTPVACMGATFQVPVAVHASDAS